ncbi:MAG: TetR/AcrR family transcriptional regulator [Polyangiales bacterium]
MSKPTSKTGAKQGKREQNRVLKRSSLVVAAIPLFLRSGAEAVSIDEITTDAGMAKGNFYRYFDDKAALLTEIVRPAASGARRAIRKCAVSLSHASDDAALSAAYLRLATDLIAIVQKHPRAVQLYLQEKRAPVAESRTAIHAFGDEVDAAAIALTKTACARGLLQVASPEVSALAVIGAVETLCLAFLQGRLHANASEAAQTLIQLVLRGVGRRD